MENTAKNPGVGIMTFIPLIVWMLFFGYYIYITRDLAISQNYDEHEKIVNAVSAHMITVSVIWGLAMLLTAIMVIYHIVHLARLRSVNAATKTVWIILMIAIAPIACPAFWLMQVRKEPNQVETYPTIA